MVKIQKALLYGRLIFFSALFVVCLFIMSINESDSTEKQLMPVIIMCCILYAGAIIYTIYQIFQPASKLIEEDKKLINGKIKYHKREIEFLEKKLKKYED